MQAHTVLIGKFAASASDPAHLTFGPSAAVSEQKLQAPLASPEEELNDITDAGRNHVKARFMVGDDLSLTRTVCVSHEYHLKLPTTVSAHFAEECKKDIGGSVLTATSFTFATVTVFNAQVDIVPKKAVGTTTFITRMYAMTSESKLVRTYKPMPIDSTAAQDNSDNKESDNHFLAVTGEFKNAGAAPILTKTHAAFFHVTRNNDPKAIPANPISATLSYLETSKSLKSAISKDLDPFLPPVLCPTVFEYCNETSPVVTWPIIDGFCDYSFKDSPEKYVFFDATIDPDLLCCLVSARKLMCMYSGAEKRANVLAKFITMKLGGLNTPEKQTKNFKEIFQYTLEHAAIPIGKFLDTSLALRRHWALLFKYIADLTVTSPKGWSHSAKSEPIICEKIDLHAATVKIVIPGNVLIWDCSHFNPSDFAQLFKAQPTSLPPPRPKP